MEFFIYRYLEEQRQLKQSEGQGQKRKKKEEEIERVKKKLKAAETDARQLTVEADSLSFKAQEQRSFTLVERSNTLRLLAKEKEGEASHLQTSLTQLQAELKTFH